jgi:hypothetical protein
MSFDEEYIDAHGECAAEIERLRAAEAVLANQLERANRIIGWMMPYIGNMCPPDRGLFDLNEHCCDNKIPEYGRETKGRPINQAVLDSPSAAAEST